MVSPALVSMMLVNAQAWTTAKAITTKAIQHSSTESTSNRKKKQGHAGVNIVKSIFMSIETLILT
jgi:hypothetical protein